MSRSGTTWIAKIFDSHPNTHYRHEPNSGGALTTMPLIAPIADKYNYIISQFIERLEDMNTPRAACSHCHTRVKDSLIPPSGGYWIFSSTYLPYIKLNYSSSRLNFGAGIIASNQKKRRRLWNK